MNQTKPSRLLASISLLFLGVALHACDNAVYHPDEIALQKRFQQANIGTTQEAIIKQLGEPRGRLVYSKARDIYQYYTSSSDVPVTEFRTLDQITGAAPSELQLLPKSKQAQLILIYIEGTVHGYFYFDPTGLLTDKAVVVS